jgi:hypothetical protein
VINSCDKCILVVAMMDKPTSQIGGGGLLLDSRPAVKWAHKFIGYCRAHPCKLDFHAHAISTQWRRRLDTQDQVEVVVSLQQKAAARQDPINPRRL